MTNTTGELRVQIHDFCKERIDENIDLKSAEEGLLDILKSELLRLKAMLPEKLPTAAPPGQLMPLGEVNRNWGFNMALTEVTALINKMLEEMK